MHQLANPGRVSGDEEMQQFLTITGSDATPCLVSSYHAAGGYSVLIHSFFFTTMSYWSWTYQQRLRFATSLISRKSSYDRSPTSGTRGGKWLPAH